jgi:cob(I)alamin adenosyltransferase
MSVVTKTGDKGITDTADGNRIPKDHIRIECLGTLDELSAFLGDARCTALKSRTKHIIEETQREFIIIAGNIAENRTKPADPGLTAPNEQRLNDLTAEFENTLPPFKEFVIPGLNPASAKLHIARTVCRRLERRLVSLDKAEGLLPGMLPFFNRLSDLLFLLARYEET